jgi:hypothetical protein
MKKKTTAKLKKDLWKVFTKYIKQRDNNKCVTCGRSSEGQGMGGGHYIAKAACGLDYYFSEKNVHAQCTYCNLVLEGNRPRYREFIIKKYGEEVLRDIENNYHKPTLVFNYEEKINYYKSLIK